MDFSKKTTKRARSCDSSESSEDSSPRHSRSRQREEVAPVRRQLFNEPRRGEIGADERQRAAMRGKSAKPMAPVQPHSFRLPLFFPPAERGRGCVQSGASERRDAIMRSWQAQHLQEQLRTVEASSEGGLVLGLPRQVIGNVNPLTSPFKISLERSETMERVDLSDEEFEDLLERGNEKYLARLVRGNHSNATCSTSRASSSQQPQPQPPSSEVAAGLCEVQVLPDRTVVIPFTDAGDRSPNSPVEEPVANTSWIQTGASGRTVEEPVASTSGYGDALAEIPGSDLDTGDSDSEFSIPLSHVRDIIQSEQTEPLLDRSVQAIADIMDAAHDDLLGESVSFDWVEDFGTFRGVRKTFLVDNVGPVEDYDDVLSAFTAIWSKDIMELIARETNRYADQFILEKITLETMTQYARLNKWRTTTVEELHVLFALFIYMGIDSRTYLPEYWTTSTVLEMPRFRQLMSYDRYRLLSTCLHFVDNSDMSQASLRNDDTVLPAKLYKLSPIIHHLNKKFQNLYVLDANIAIDESLTLFKGQLSWIQCIRSKSARFGIKSYELCESSTGYLAKFKIYVGKETGTGGVAPVQQLIADLGGKTTAIVLNLLNGLDGKGYCVTMDNFYNSPALARHLKSLGFDCLGTLRANRRHVPEAVKTMRSNVPKGTIVARHCGDISVVAWKDSKVVPVISTYHNDSVVESTKAGKRIIKPACVRDYNASMGGIDLKDQKLSMYLMERKRGVKWYIKMFKRLLNVSVHNAYIMYSASQHRKGANLLSHRQFRYGLANALVAHVNVQQPAQVPRNQELTMTRLRTDIMHVPYHRTGRKGRKQCALCMAVRGIRKQLNSGCEQCGVALCFVTCWREWHSVLELRRV